MDKQEAISFIIQELENNCTKEEVIASLSFKLGAPEDMVRKFVNQIVGEDLPVPITQEQVAPALNASPVYLPSEMDSYPPESQNLPIQTPHVLQVQDEPAGPQDVAQAPASIQPADKLAQDKEIETFILQAIGKHYRPNDVVVLVCEKTGLSWDQAQRLVARISTKNSNNLVKKQNRFMIPFALIVTIAGLVLALASGNEVFNYVVASLSFPTSEMINALPNIDQILRDLPWFLTGIVLFIGGAIGLFLAVRSQFE